MYTKYIEKIIATVADNTEVSAEDIVSKSRKETVSFARKLFVSCCYRYSIPTSAIANYLNRSNDGIRKLYISYVQYVLSSVEKNTERVITEKLDSFFIDKDKSD
ncbi:MAG: hypothetical protein J6Z01_15105 [Bacteroidales bacterium]|nr:hypothetical protein [Bacteroidales bacterium]